MNVWTVPPETPVTIRRVLDDGKRNPPALSVTLDVLTDFRVVDSYPPGGAARLAATITRTTRPFHPRGTPEPWPEWMDADEEVVVIDPGANSGVLLAALGHRAAGHSCADCAPEA